tara:strand:+ start:647 stop:916 length:270 start_codon:yes stop_codon:yes gene_type:complete
MADETFTTDTACGDPYFKETEETPAGVKGNAGDSAYDIYIAGGGTATETDFNTFITNILSGGVPTGYEETVLDVCVSGSVVSKTFLTKI